MNKRQTNIVKTYRMSTDRRLEDVYNTFIFTCAYRYEDVNGLIHLVYHTATKKDDFIIL